MAISSQENWTGMLANLCRHFNGKKIRGTTFRRRDVTAKNFLDYMDELKQSDDVTMLFNAENIPQSSLKLLRHAAKHFKFEVGQRVLLSRKVHYAVVEKGAKQSFPKPTVEGSFSPTVYVVTKLETRLTAVGDITPGKRGRLPVGE